VFSMFVGIFVFYFLWSLLFVNEWVVVYYVWVLSFCWVCDFFFFCVWFWVWGGLVVGDAGERFLR